MSKSKKKKSSKTSKKKGVKKENETGAQSVETTLHGYPMTGPFTPSQKDAIWYCDNKKCQYTQHGVFRRYKIQNWRSTQYGKKYVLCDGCVRQYRRQTKTQPQSQGAANVNVKLNINGINPSYQPQMPMQPGAIVPMQQTQYNQQLQQMMKMQQQMYNPQQQMYNPQQQNIYHPQKQMMPGQAYNYQQPQQTMVAMQQQSAQPMPQPQQQQQPVEEKENIYADSENGNGGMENEIMTNGVVKQGWMMKKGDIIKSWKKRYFVLKSNKVLNYYESDNAVMVKGTCKLDRMKSVKTKSGQSFEIDTPKRKWCFACKDTKTRDAWVNKIKSVAGS